jgi:hypothetical protein
MKTPLPLLVLLAVLAVGLTGCDTTGSEETAILNANSPVPPTVEYTFDYETGGNQQIGTRSLESDNLTSILTQNGFSRADVSSAQVDSVQLERLSLEEAAPPPKVFDYLTQATLYLGPNASDGQRIAQASFDRAIRSVPLRVVSPDVTSLVKDGSRPAFLQLDATSDVPDRTDRVRVTVYFRIEVQGI